MTQVSCLLDKASDIIQDVRYEERECLDNMPENLQNSDRYDAMDAAVDSLGDALDSIREAKGYVEQAGA